MQIKTDDSPRALEVLTGFLLFLERFHTKVFMMVRGFSAASQCHVQAYSLAPTAVSDPVSCYSFKVRNSGICETDCSLWVQANL